ncbi:cadmium resistance transporter [Corynebacterium liangguodongii]|uniref:Cadmium transporter n=1 Tax=Corynebacterium liangguodongii TaxID=2079535 RepID=A0A2S0WBP4_9CORY|nr:cadmium resistance transporter [Corynebacterium liangguodongii]AWB83185.1 cadmium transporter [Corynebacterium liangguodongii]PWB98780.1 cadmium transporter [Corynebacterium liangguodongii]
MLATIAQAALLFAATNIDDIIVLALFFARGAGEPLAWRRILAGQYVGFAGILAVSLLSAWGAAALFPPSAIPYLGLIPLAIGLKSAWDAYRGEDDDDLAGSTRVTTVAVAAVTFANGGDNIGLYLPVFITAPEWAVAVYCGVFLVLVAALVWLARFAATRPGIREWLERSDKILFPAVMIVLGVVILGSGVGLGSN